ncbi:MAG: group II intron reverse transcriptase/maturase [Opitutus sp.]|nr:group II intron reverse transcriptase/maturase [Opitutus sp.]MCS6244089.1 group II intron reverse transcriptase/maturase [Opitutus sp.]MCS6276602.1 group II intron reverse transcriptase/maturase [Opitutus sp.]MCS6277187.1 group II intron reverse transcriptase/maturase [Opitutus sp.]MCS6300309.1 group II intron reverse transcriptase/maturase [Opitutus sp.]
MSSVTETTDESSRYLNGEDCKDRKRQSRKDVGPKSLISDQHVGGVSGGGGVGKVVRLSGETCGGGASCDASTTGTSAAKPRKAGRAVAGVGDLHSSDDLADIKTAGERREGTCSHASQSGKGPDDGWGDELWIKTSPKVRKLQRVLYRKAKAEPHWRFYSLYGELYRQDILSDALDQVIANDGVPGVDGFEVETLVKNEAYRAAWLLALAEEMRTKTYRPSPVLRVYIWKDQARTKRRALGIPTVKDRVVQSAAVIVLQPILEADFHDHSYAYRPKRRTHQAMDKVKEAMLSGKVEVVDADLSSYFDMIPHRELLQLVAKRVSDGSVLRLIKTWLRAPIVEEDRDTGCRKVSANRCGTPQGGVISPLLANLYLNDLDHAVNEKCEQKPTMVRYADDLLILCKPGQGAGLQTRLKRWLEARKLKLNEEKTRLVDTRKEGFEFLGFSVAWRQGMKSKRRYPHVDPSAKSLAKLRDKVRMELDVRTRNQPAVAVVRKVNQITRGWATAFHYGNSTHVFSNQQAFVRNRLRRWLWRKYSRTHGLFEFFTDDRLHGQYKLWHWPLTAAWKQ